MIYDFLGARKFFVMFRHSISVRLPRDGNQPAQEVLLGCLNSSYVQPA